MMWKALDYLTLGFCLFAGGSVYATLLVALACIINAFGLPAVVAILMAQIVIIAAVFAGIWALTR